MDEALLALAVIVALGVASVAQGRGILQALRARRLLRPGLESLLLAVFVGTAWLILLCGWLSYLGLSARQWWPVVALSLCAWLVPAARDWRGWLACWRALCGRQRWPALCLLLAGLLSQAGLLRQVWLFQWANPFTDSLTYVQLSQFLQEDGLGVGIAPLDEQLPTSYMVCLYSRHGLRMGSTWLLALLQACTGRDGLALFWPLSGFGVLLNLAGTYLVGRWALRLPWQAACGAALFAAAPCSPLQAALGLGFQPQLFGTAFFLAVLAILGRCLRAAEWAGATAAVLALLTSAFVSAYSEMAPLLGLVAVALVAVLTVRARQAKQLRRLALFVLATALGLLLLGNFEWARTAQAFKLQAHNLYGWLVPWPREQFVLFSFGLTPYNLQAAHPAQYLALVPAAALAVLGFRVLVWHRRWETILAVGLFGGLWLYYAFLTRDPRSGLVGHTWSLFKLAKWAFPLVVLLPFLGLSALLARRAWPKEALLIPGVLLFFGCLCWPEQCSQFLDCGLIPQFDFCPFFEA